MRIIAGRLGGRVFDSPGGNRTHPMSEKVRGALFNSLGDISGLTVLDAFSGSGALGFEALSRGAYSVLAVEIDPRAQKIIARNVTHLGLRRQMKLISASLSGWLRTSGDIRFDIIVCDPPYNALQIADIKLVSARLQEHGMLVVSLPSPQDIDFPAQISLIQSKNYGDTQLQFYRREA